MNRRYDLVILDFHGTQTDHALRVVRSYHRAAKTMFGSGFNKGFYQQLLMRPIQSNGGTSHKEYIWKLFETLPVSNRERFYELFKRSMDETFIPIPTVRQTCRTLREAGVAIAILTNGTNRPDIEATLKGWGLDFLLRHLYTGHEIGAKKPDPEAINHVMQDMGDKFVASRTLVVGDYRGDLEAAAGAGTDSALIVRVHSAQILPIVEPRPTYVVTEPSELVPIVAGLREAETRTDVPLSPLLWKHEGGMSVAREKGY